MPAIGLNVMVTGFTTQTVKNVDGFSVLNFYIEENLGEREQREFWLEVRHDPNHRYLSNKTNSINQNMRSTTAVLSGIISYEPPIVDPITAEETTPEKHILSLDDVSLISLNRNSGNTSQSLNLPWLNQGGSNNANRSSRLYIKF
jgi:hypothetical protein